MYNYYFEIASLAVMLLLTIRFFTIKQFNDPTSKIFGTLLILVILDVSIDIVSCFTIEHINEIPLWVQVLTNGAFYMYQILVPLATMLFICTLSVGYETTKKKYWWAFVTSIIEVFMLFINPWSKLYFYITGTPGNYEYHTGFGAYLLYANCFFVLIISLIIASKNKKNIAKRQFRAIVAYTIIAVSFSVFQIFFPPYLLTGSSMTLAMILMSFALHNPENMLDGVSQALNSRALMLFLNTAKDSGKQVYLITVDINSLGQISRAFGISTAEKLLADIGNFLNSISEHDWVFRMSGYRFMVASYDEVKYLSMINVIQSRFKDSWDMSGSEIILNPTILRHVEKQVKDPEGLISLIIASIEDAGETEKEEILTVNQESIFNAQKRFNIETELKHAIKPGSKSFSLRFQPIYNIHEKTFTSAEVLLRMTDREGEIMMPSDFIPIAEITGIINTIDQIVIKKTAEFLKSRQELMSLGLTSMHINLSASEDFDSIQPKIEECIEENNINPRLITLEITEGCLAQNPKSLKRFMAEMQNNGYRFAIDDFGTGYSNLALTSKISANIIKTDLSLISDFKSETERVVFKDMIQMLKHIAKYVIVEGVETKEQLDFVCDCGADYIQGFYFSKPLVEEDYIEFMRKHTGAN